MKLRRRFEFAYPMPLLDRVLFLVVVVLGPIVALAALGLILWSVLR